MWFTVYHWPQSQEGVSVRPHFCKLAGHCTLTVHQYRHADLPWAAWSGHPVVGWWSQAQTWQIQWSAAPRLSISPLTPPTAPPGSTQRPSTSPVNHAAGSADSHQHELSITRVAPPTNSMICCTSSVNLATDSAHSSAWLYIMTFNITSQSRSHQHQLSITCPTPATAPHCSSVTNISGLLLWLK